MLQAPSPFRSHTCGYAIWSHWRSPTSSCPAISASPILTTPSPLMSPQAIGMVVVVGCVVLLVVVVGGVVVVLVKVVVLVDSGVVVLVGGVVVVVGGG